MPYIGDIIRVIEGPILSSNSKCV